MIAKKNPKADLEKKRFAFFQIGLIIAGSACLAAFEYSSAKVEKTFAHDLNNEMVTCYFPDPPVTYIPRPQQEKKRQMVIIRDDITLTDEDDKANDGAVFIDEKISFDDSDFMGDEDGDFGIAVIEDSTIIEVPDKEPQFPGGFAEMARFINKNIDLPDYMMETGIVYIQFVVNKDGSTEQVQIQRGVSNELDNAAKDVVKKMPNWIPGEQAGKPVRVRFTLPINIQPN